MTEFEKSELPSAPSKKPNLWSINLAIALLTSLLGFGVAWILFSQHSTAGHEQAAPNQSAIAAQPAPATPVSPEQEKFQDAMNSAKENGFWNFEDAMASLKTAQNINDNTLKSEQNDHAVKMLREHVLLTANIFSGTIKRYQPGIDGLKELLSSPLTTKVERARLWDDAGLFFRIFSGYADNSVKDQDFIRFGQMAIAEGSKNPLVAMAIADGCFGNKFDMNYSISVRPNDAGCVIAYASLAMTFARKAGLKKNYGVSGTGPEHAGDLEPFDQADALEKLFWAQAFVGDQQGAEQTYDTIEKTMPTLLNDVSEEGGRKSYEKIFSSALKAIPKVLNPPASMIDTSGSTRL